MRLAMEERVSEHPTSGTEGNDGFPRLGIQRLSRTARRLRTDDGEHPVPAAGPPLAPAELCLAELRPVPGIPETEQVPQLLAREARRAAALGNRGACAADQAGGDPRHRRRVQAALITRVIARSQRVRPEVAGPMTGSATKPSKTTCS